MKDILLPLLTGCLTGILSAWGVGGGTLLLLIMTLLLGVDQTTAQGVNLLYFLPTAAAGLICHGKNGLLDRELVRQTAAWGLFSAAAMAWLTTALDPGLLRRPFGIFLLIAGVMTLLKKENA